MYLWKNVYEKIIMKICTGELKPGDKLPSIREAALEYGVSVVVIKKAYDALKEACVVASVPGKGTFIIERDEKKLISKQLYKCDVEHIDKKKLGGVAYTLRNLYTEMWSGINEPPYYDILRVGAVKLAVEVFNWLAVHIPEDMTVEEYLKSLEKSKEYAEKIKEVIEKNYDKHISDDNILTDEERNAIQNFSDDIFYEIEYLTKKMTDNKEKLKGED